MVCLESRLTPLSQCRLKISDFQYPEPDPAPNADDPPVKKPKSAPIAAKELRRQLAAMKKRLAGKEAEVQGLAEKRNRKHQNVLTGTMRR